MVPPLCPDDLSHESFKYFRALQTYLGAIPVTMLRVSYVGELGWEIYTSAEYGAALWDLLTDGRDKPTASSPRAASRSTACASKRATGCWGTDMTAEHQPAAAGVEFAVRMAKDDFIGKAALGTAPENVLRSIVFDEPDSRRARQGAGVYRRSAASATSPARAIRRPSAAPSPTRGCRRRTGDR